MGACGSTALRSRTTAPCAGRGSPPSEQGRGSERTAASESWSQQEQSSWPELCGLVGAERRWVNILFWVFRLIYNQSLNK